MRCLNKHIYHFSALLGPVTVGTDAVFLFFPTTNPHSKWWTPGHEDLKTGKIHILMKFNSVILSHDGTALKHGLIIYWQALMSCLIYVLSVYEWQDLPRLVVCGMSEFLDWHSNNAWPEPVKLNQCCSQVACEGPRGLIGRTYELVKLSGFADHKVIRCSNTRQITEHATQLHRLSVASYVFFLASASSLSLRSPLTLAACASASRFHSIRLSSTPSSKG